VNDLSLPDLLTHFEIDCVLDVGANRGQFARSLRDAGYRGDIHSFEPVAATYRALREAADGDARWRAWPLALGPRVGRERINVLADDGYSSLLDPNESPDAHFGDQLERRREETITVTTLDAFLDEHGEAFANRRILLKMDTQGYDLEVVRGAARSLARIPVILSEIAFMPLYQHAPDYLEALASYQQLGFHLACLIPTHRRETDLALIEAACCLVNVRGKPEIGDNRGGQNAPI